MEWTGATYIQKTFYLFEAVSHTIAQTGLELTM